ncbi:MAG TPA: ABC transporter permease [Nitrobacter sp.]|nr:ABC transporter permease [Nitrobacter sp.]
MMRALWSLAVLLSHWRRHPAQLATLLIGLISATALWSGVQALNQQARNAYDQAAALFGGARTAMLVAQRGDVIPQRMFVDLRRAGWPVSPILEGRIRIDGHSVRLIGIEPVTLPAKAGAIPAIGRATLQSFLAPPGLALLAPETASELHAVDGAALRSDDGTSLPPLKSRPQLAPGVIVVDIGQAQRILRQPNEISRLLVGDVKGKHLPLATVAGDALRLVAPNAETDLERLTDSFHLNLTAFGLLSFLVGLFIVNSAIGLAFEQRLPTIRTLRACGISARLLSGTLLAELVLLALVSGLIGLICGYLIASALLPNVAISLRGLYGADIPGQLTLRPEWWAAGLAMSVLGAAAAAALGLLRVARLPVLAAAQPSAWRQAQQRRLTLQGAAAVVLFCVAAGLLRFGESLISGFAVLAALMLGAALALPVLLGFVLALGERTSRRPVVEWVWADARQQLSGLSLALMALLLALSVNIGVGTMVETFSKTFTTWLDGRLTADIYVRPIDAGQAHTIESWLRKRPDVKAILPGARADVRIAGQPVEVLGLADDDAYRARWPLLQSSANAWNEVRKGSGVLISEQLARRLKLGLGDRVIIPAPAGDWPAVIVGFYADYGNPKGQLGVDINVLKARFPKMTQSRFGLRVAPEQVAPLIEAMRSAFYLDSSRLSDQSTLKAESTRIFNRTFAVTAALNTFTLGVAGIALLTSLLTLSASRLPQLAPLWAIGLTRRRLAVLELFKTLSIALITALLAIPLGLVVAWCLIAVVNVRSFGWRLPFHVFPQSLIELLGVAMLAALLAMLAPAIRLWRMQPARLLRIFADER